MLDANMVTWISLTTAAVGWAGPLLMEAIKDLTPSLRRKVSKRAVFLAILVGLQFAGWAMLSRESDVLIPWLTAALAPWLSGLTAYGIGKGKPVRTRGSMRLPVLVVLVLGGSLVFGCSLDAEVSVTGSDDIASSASIGTVRPAALASTESLATSPAVRHLATRFGCTRTRAQLGLGGPWAVGRFHPDVPCSETCSDRYGLPDTHQGKPVRWELAPGASPHSRGALRLLETMLSLPDDPLAGGGIRHQGSDALAEQDLALMHCGSTPAYTWLADRLANQRGGRAVIASHRGGDELLVDGVLVATGCDPCRWELDVHRSVPSTGPFDPGRRVERVGPHIGARWELDLPAKWAGAAAVVSVSQADDPSRTSPPIELRLVAPPVPPTSEPPPPTPDPPGPATCTAELVAELEDLLRRAEECIGPRAALVLHELRSSEGGTAALWICIGTEAP